MNWISIPAIAFALSALAGCATSASPSVVGGCNSELGQSAVGQAVTPDLLEKTRAATGSQTARALRPDDVITMEYNSERINLRVDQGGIVTALYCG